MTASSPIPENAYAMRTHTPRLWRGLEYCADAREAEEFPGARCSMHPPLEGNIVAQKRRHGDLPWQVKPGGFYYESRPPEQENSGHFWREAEWLPTGSP